MTEELERLLDEQRRDIALARAREAYGHPVHAEWLAFHGSHEVRLDGEARWLRAVAPVPYWR